MYILTVFGWRHAQTIQEWYAGWSVGRSVHLHVSQTTGLTRTVCRRTETTISFLSTCQRHPFSFTFSLINPPKINRVSPNRTVGMNDCLHLTPPGGTLRLSKVCADCHVRSDETCSGQTERVRKKKRTILDACERDEERKSSKYSHEPSTVLPWQSFEK